MPAPHDQRFCILFKFAQQKDRHTDQQLLALFESSLKQVLKDQPSLAEDEAIPKAMRSWCRSVIPEEGTPEFLGEDVRLKRSPRYGDAVVVPSQAKGTFWWNRKSKKVQWVWWDPDPSRAGEILHTEPQSALSHPSEGQHSPNIAIKTEPRDNEDEMENAVYSAIGQTGANSPRLGSTLPERAERNHQIRKGKGKEILPEKRRSPNSELSHFTPNALHRRSSSYPPTTPTKTGSRPNSINPKPRKNDKNLDDMADNAPPAPHQEEGPRSRTSYSVQPVSRSPSLVSNDSADTSIILTDTYTYNQYATMFSFITEKALKAGWSSDECDDCWEACLAQSRREFREKGRAYIRYNAELNYWCNLFPDEVFPGRDPRTGEINMSTGRELSAAQRQRQRGEGDDDASELSLTRSPSSEPPRQRARTGTMADVHANGNRANGNGTNAN